MKRFGKVLAAMAGVVALVGIGSTATAQELGKIDPGDLQEHCPDHEDLEADGQKVTASGDPASADETITVDGIEVQVVIDGEHVSFFDSDGDPIDVEFCIKAGNAAGGILTGSGGSVIWSANGEGSPDISYVVVYRVFDEENGDEEEEEEVVEEVVEVEVVEVEVEVEAAPPVKVQPVFTG
jgi:hypothetical protein